MLFYILLRKMFRNDILQSENGQPRTELPIASVYYFIYPTASWWEFGQKPGIIKHLRAFCNNKTTQIKPYRELSRVQVRVYWCKLDISDCPTKKQISHLNTVALYTKTPRKSSDIIAELCPFLWEKPFCTPLNILSAVWEDVYVFPKYPFIFITCFFIYTLNLQMKSILL